MHDPATPTPPILPAMLWAMRALSLAALAVGGFLLYLHVGYGVFAATSKVPFCGWASWLDCDAVLYHPKWSNIAGVPVALPGVLLYLAVAVALFMIKPATAAARPMLWKFLHFAGVLIIAAAAWFIYLQLGQIKKVCQFCVIEHAIGVALAMLLITTAGRLRVRGRAIGTLLAVAAVAVAAGLQATQKIDVVRRVVIGEVDASNRYTEPEFDLSLASGTVNLRADAHPVLGNPHAAHVFVEMIDYTCPRCAKLHRLLRDARPELGDDYAFLVLTYPLNADCNPAMQETEPRHADACFLARLAHAVWLTDAPRFEPFHAWLFENQDGMTREKALEHAATLVDVSRLHGWLSDERLDNLLKRDIEAISPRFMTPSVGYLELPGLYVGDYRVAYVPDSARELVERLREAAAAE